MFSVRKKFSVKFYFTTVSFVKKILTNNIMKEYEVALDHYQDYRFLVNAIGKKTKALLDLIKRAKEHMDELKWKTIVNEEILKKEFKLQVEMNDIPKEELDEKFNKLLNDPEREDLIDEIKKNLL